MIFKKFFCFFVGFLFVLQGLSSEEVNEEIRPYLLPMDSPYKPLIDAIFTSQRASFNLKSLKKAGFLKAKPRRFTHLLVTKHPAISEIIFKLYLDTQRYPKNNAEWKLWILRIKGTHLIRRMVENNHWETIFKVPQKWIYLLPKFPKPPLGYFPKETILVEEDMEILSTEENEKKWKSSAVTKDLLDKIYYLLIKLGLGDCAKPDNIPFSKDGRIAFVDTQTFGEKKINFDRLTPYLSEENKKYWKALTQK